MPVFRATNGKALWISAQSVLRAEQGEGGLTTMIHMIPPPGSPPGSVMLTEVEGTVYTVGDMLDQALREQA